MFNCVFIYIFVDLSKLKPRETRVGRIPKLSSKNKYLTAAIWLNNNKLTSTKVVSNIANYLLEFPEQLSWIDISFNNIDDINEVLTNIYIFFTKKLFIKPRTHVHIIHQ